MFPLVFPVPNWHHTVSSISLTIYPVLSFAFPPLFCNYRSVFLSAFTFFTQSPKLPHLWQPSVCSMYLWVCFYLFICLHCFLDSTYAWNKWYLSFYNWLISLSIIFSRSIHAVTEGKIFFFYMAKGYRYSLKLVFQVSLNIFLEVESLGQ